MAHPHPIIASESLGTINIVYFQLGQGHPTTLGVPALTFHREEPSRLKQNGKDAPKQEVKGSPTLIYPPPHALGPPQLLEAAVDWMERVWGQAEQRSVFLCP